MRGPRELRRSQSQGYLLDDDYDDSYDDDDVGMQSDPPDRRCDVQQVGFGFGHGLFLLILIQVIRTEYEVER